LSIGLLLECKSVLSEIITQRLICFNRDNGPCRVTVDGRDEKIVTAYSATYGRAILLYQKSDLDPRVPHTIAITVIQETTVPNDCHLDYFV